MDRRLSYRRGLPMLKPLPLVTESVRDETALTGKYAESDLTSEIRAILRTYKVYVHSVCLKFRFHKTSPKSRNATYFVEGDLQKSPVEGWELAVQAIRDFLDARNLNHIFVEIVDQQSIRRTSFVITEDLFVEEKVDSLFTSAGLYLKDLGLEYTRMTLVYRGRGLADRRPTFLIISPNLDDSRWWDEVLLKLKEMCLDVSPSLDVELIYGVRVL